MEAPGARWGRAAATPSQDGGVLKEPPSSSSSSRRSSHPTPSHPNPSHPIQSSTGTVPRGSQGCAGGAAAGPELVPVWIQWSPVSRSCSVPRGVATVGGSKAPQRFSRSLLQIPRLYHVPVSIPALLCSVTNSSFCPSLNFSKGLLTATAPSPNFPSITPDPGNHWGLCCPSCCARNSFPRCGIHTEPHSIPAGSELFPSGCSKSPCPHPAPGLSLPDPSLSNSFCGILSQDPSPAPSAPIKKPS